MTKESKAFGTQRANKQHLVLGKGGVAGEVADLRRDVEEGFQNNEERAGFPEVDWVDGGAMSVDGGDDFVIKGSNLLQDQEFDSVTLGTGNAAVTFSALKPGEGSGLSVVIEQGVGALAVDLTDGLLTVTLAAANSTATEVAAAVNADSDCIGVILAVAGGTGADDVVVATETELTGGVGTYAENKVLISGVEALPKQEADSWGDDSITVKTPDLTAETDARAEGDLATIRVMVDGKLSLQATMALGAA